MVFPPLAPYNFPPYFCNTTTHALMNRSRVIVTIACIFISLGMSGCHSRRKAAEAHVRPKFINDVSFAPHNKASVTHNAIDPKKNPVRPKPKAAPATVAATAGEKAESPNAVRRKYADIIGVKPKDISNTALYQFIDKWYGTNYRLGGQDNSGIDCSGFAQKLYGEVYGVDLSRTSREQFSNCTRVKHANEGDLVFFNIHSKHVTHVGVYLGNDYFVHSSTTGGVMISSLNEDYWHKYYTGFGRVKG